jgi:hypothetical protein
VRLRGTDGMLGRDLGVGEGADDDRAHDDAGPAGRARPLRALADHIGAYTRVYLLERLVGTTVGTVPERLRHRDGPLHFSAH